MRLALRLIAVGVVVLASLLIAGGAQIAARRTEIASYTVGRHAVRLVERLDDVWAALAPYRTAAAVPDRAAAAEVRTALTAAAAEARRNDLGGALPQTRLDAATAAWSATPRPGPALARATNELVREIDLRIGAVALAHGSVASADGVLAEASLLALPAAGTQFERLTTLITAASGDPSRVSRGSLSRDTLAALFLDARSAADVALDSPWIDTLPSPIREQAQTARSSVDRFLALFRAHIARGDALRSRALLAPATAAAGQVAALEATLLPLLDQRLRDAQQRAQNEIISIVVLAIALIATIGILSAQVLRTQIRSRNARLAFAHQAMHDALTGLPNRRAFTQALGRAVAAWTPVNDRTRWILSIDLDFFKEVNDRYGHQTGDEFLIAASRRLAGATPDGDVLARVGGDEFAIIVHHDDPDSSHALIVAEAICAAFIDPIDVDGVEHRLAASVGVVAIDALHETVDSLLRDADIAMYRAKEDGGDRVVVFDDALRQKIVERAQLAADLDAALARATGPRVVFQPILSLDDRTCYGFEALVRWRHPVRGEIDAWTLIDIAQEARLIVPLGRRVVNEVCRHLAGWRDQGLSLDQLSIHVNVSPMEAAHVATYASIAEALERWRIPPETLVIELTETASIDSIDTAGRFLSNMHELGVRVCLDDFGTGYSSLRHLNDFQVDEIKIDRSFVVSAAQDAAKLPILAGIIALARGLDAEIIAEGIETIEQRRLVDDLGCRLVQGYLFARPMPPEEALRFAQRTKPAAASAHKREKV